MTGRIAMKVAWAWELASYSTIKNFQWEVAPVPKPPQRKRTYIFDDAGLCLSSQSKHPEAAFRFIKYYTGIKGMKLFGKARNGIPALKEAAYTTFIEPPPYHLKDYLKAAEKANIPWNPRIGRWDEIEQPFGREMTLVFLGKEDLNTAIRKIVSETNRLLSENK
jgi:multiple sugar transport system substrate-binding protein